MTRSSNFSKGKKLKGSALLREWKKFCADPKASGKRLHLKTGYISKEGRITNQDTQEFNKELSRAMAEDAQVRKMKEALAIETLNKTQNNKSNKYNEPWKNNKKSRYIPNLPINKCALYLVKDSMSGDVKIGISNNPKERYKRFFSEYNVGTIREISTTWFPSREEARHWEKNFHKRYSFKHSPARGGKEWFTLNESEIMFFQEWMRRSSEKRSFKVIKLETKIKKNDEKLFRDYRNNFLSGFFISIFTGIIPAISFLIFQIPIGVFIGPIFVGIYFARKTEKDEVFSKEYDEDGLPLSFDVPKREYKEMNLWSERVLKLPAHTLSDKKQFPKKLEFDKNNNLLIRNLNREFN